MNHTEATQYIKQTLATFSPRDNIPIYTWVKLHEAMSVLIEQSAQQDTFQTDPEDQAYANDHEATYGEEQRKPLTPEWIWMWLRNWCDRHPSLRQETYNSLYKMVSDARDIE